MNSYVTAVSNNFCCFYVQVSLSSNLKSLYESTQCVFVTILIFFFIMCLLSMYYNVRIITSDTSCKILSVFSFLIIQCLLTPIFDLDHHPPSLFFFTKMYHPFYWELIWKYFLLEKRFSKNIWCEDFGIIYFKIKVIQNYFQVAGFDLLTAKKWIWSFGYFSIRLFFFSYFM